jgi:hypothetical protein
MKDMQRVAIFGGGGQLGVELNAVFREAGYEVTSYERSRIDITNGLDGEPIRATLLGVSSDEFCAELAPPQCPELDTAVKIDGPDTLVLGAI